MPWYRIRLASTAQPWMSVDVAAPVVAVCMRVLIVSSGNMAQCSVVPASAPLSMCP